MNIDRRVEVNDGPESDRREGVRPQSPWPSGDVEDTDLERRVLANERILRALNAHVAEAEPKFVAHLGAVFSEPPHKDLVKRRRRVSDAVTATTRARIK